MREKVLVDGVVAQAVWQFAGRDIVIQQYGHDDYAFYDEFNDCSVRGTYKQIVEELVMMKEQ